METIRRNEVEIMAPVGCYESLHAALDAGANSIYFGVEQLNMRAKSAFNFTLDDLAKIVDLAHQRGVKAYLTVNTILYDADLDDMRRIMDRAQSEGIDAVIASDQAAIAYARRIGLEVHISTQLNLSNIEAVAFYAQYADVMVLARELSIEQIEALHREIEQRDLRGPSGQRIRIEMFAHGALCMAISGKCYLSLHLTGCSANRGSCRQICRRSYTATDRETGDQIELDGPYMMSPKDLCTIDFLDRFLDAGVRVLKIEGRARSGEYVKRVVECYDAALHAIEEGTYTPEQAAQWKEQLQTVFNRGFWSGYYMGERSGEWSRKYGSSATMRKLFIGKITNFFAHIGVAEIAVEANPVSVGEEVFVSGETTGIVEFTVDEIRVALHPVAEAPQGVFCSIKTPQPVRRGDKLYKMVPVSSTPTAQ